jgi:hypothetical protein
MTAVLMALLASLRTTIRSRCELGAEILALRPQLAVLQRTTPTRPRLRPIDRLLWVVLWRVLAELAARHADRDARHCPALASARVRCLLALELATAPRWSASAGR